MMFAFGASVVLRHRLVLKTLSIINTVSAVCLVILVIFFALDVLQVRANVQVEARSMFQAGAAKATLKHLTAVYFHRRIDMCPIGQVDIPG
jgi:hypothetical protein